MCISIYSIATIFSLVLTHQEREIQLSAEIMYCAFIKNNIQVLEY